MDLSKQSLVACSALVLDLNDLVFFKGNQELNSYSPKFPTTFVLIFKGWAVTRNIYYIDQEIYHRFIKNIVRLVMNKYKNIQEGVFHAIRIICP